MLETRLIGKFEIRFDGRPITISSRSAQSLFAYLILTTGILHRREKLAGMFWPDMSEAKARAYLRHELWRIRKTLSSASKFEYLLADDIHIAFNGSTAYWLDVAMLTTSREGASTEELKEALSVYQGELLPGFYDDWVLVEREHVQSVYEQKITRLLELLQKEKRWHEILEWAERWISFGQVPEAAYRALIVAYDALGDDAKVATTYERCVQALKVLGHEPSEETRSLASRQHSKVNIPIPLTSFIGRETELKEVVNLLTKSRLVTLTGSGGVGKTRLAIQVVPEILARFPDGVWFLDLAPLSDPALVPTTLANLLGLRESAEMPVPDLLINYFRSRTALVIFDNCEHLIESCAQLITSLLIPTENLVVLATSRETLRVSGEIPYRVPSLTTPRFDTELGIDDLVNIESVRLFTERAALICRGFAFNMQNAFDIARICQRLDGIPLAIELAAARTNVLTVEQISKRLDDRFNLLASGLRSSLPRHQTLHAIIEWSYDLLSEKERILFRRLAVFVGGWTLEAAEEVCVGEDIQSNDVLALLSELANKSLIFVETGNKGENRYRRLETIRQYAQEKLWLGDERELMRQRHLSYFVELAERAELNLRAFDMVLWLDRLEAELDNLRVAITYALESDIEEALRLTSALLWFWNNRGPWKEAIEWLDRALSIEAAERGVEPLRPHRAMIRGKALNASAKLMFIAVEDRKVKAYLEESLSIFQDLGPAGKPGLAYALLRGAELPSANPQRRSILERSLALFRELGDKFGIAECLLLLADLAHQNNDYEQAILLSEEQLIMRREMGDQDGIAWVLGTLGDLAFWQNDYQRAIVLQQESLAMFHEVENKWAIGHGLSILGDTFFGQRDYDQAAEKYEEALTFAQDIGERFLTALNFYNLGAIAWLQGKYARANQMISNALALLREVGNDRLRELTASCIHTLGDIALAQGDDRSAVHWYEAELTFGKETQLDLSIMFALGGLGKAAWVRGDYELANKRLEEGLRLSRKGDSKPVMLLTLCGLGRVTLSQGDYGLAHDFLAQASEIPLQESNNLIRWVWLKTYGAATAHPLEAFAILAIMRNQKERAARLFGAAESLYLPIRFALSTRERDEHNQAIMAARGALGEESFSVAFERGKEMSLDRAVAYALDETQ